MSDVTVFACVKSEITALVCWIYSDYVDSSIGEDDNCIVGWEIFRYRQIPGVENEWNLKGKSFVEGGETRCAVISDMASEAMYRFSVRAVYLRGAPSIESSQCSPIMLEKPLPNGWLRMYDNESNMFYYANWRTRRRCWERPDADPYFLDETVAVMFSDIEISFLMSCFQELITNHGSVNPRNFRSRVLVRVGEVYYENDVVVIFKHFSRKTGDIPPAKLTLTTWKQFMNVVFYIKKQRIKYVKNVWNQRASRMRNYLIDKFINRDDGEERLRVEKARRHLR